MRRSNQKPRESYFWVCLKCGKYNQDTKVCECGNKHYGIHDMWPIIDKPIKEAIKEYLSSK